MGKSLCSVVDLKGCFSRFRCLSSLLVPLWPFAPWVGGQHPSQVWKASKCQLLEVTAKCSTLHWRASSFAEAAPLQADLSRFITPGDCPRWAIISTVVFIQVPEEHFPWQYDLNLTVVVKAAARADVSGPDTCMKMGEQGNSYLHTTAGWRFLWKMFSNTNGTHKGQKKACFRRQSWILTFLFSFYIT